ncbi:MAG: rhomboid family intramembrane serine protease [Anaerolineales bacterium]
MIPLRDTVRSRATPWVNYTLIALNLAVFFYEASLTRGHFQAFLTSYGLVPARLSAGNPIPYASLFTSMFLHGSWFHVLSNMWVLFIFGDNVEDRMGSGRYLSFYLLAGVVAGLTQVAFAPSSQIPTVGASGAIAGVLGAYLILYPSGRVLTLILLIFLPWLVEIPAYLFLGLWFLSQLSSGLLSLGHLGSGQFSGIAWWAHVGGFLFGLILVRVFARRSSAWRI